MPLSISCPHCVKSFTLPDEYAGKSVFCLYCGKPFTAEQIHDLSVQRPTAPTGQEIEKSENPRIRFHCPSCKSMLEAPTAGKKCNCPTCGQRILVPVAKATNKTTLGILPGEPSGDSLPWARQVVSSDAITSITPIQKPAPPREPAPEIPWAVPLGQPQQSAAISSSPGVARVPALPAGVEAHRASTVFVLAIIGLFFLPFILCPIAWLLGAEDLGKMRAGQMDKSGEGLTSAGYIIGIVGTIYGVIAIAWFCIFFAMAIHGPRTPVMWR